MKKALKILLSTISGIVIFVIMLPIVLSILLQVSAVQNYAAGKASAMLSELAGARISIGRVDIGFFNRAIFEDVLMEDQRGDTMIYARGVDAAINGINFLTGKISMGRVELTGGQVNLYKDSLGVMNVNRVFENFKPEKPNPNPPNFRMSCTELVLVDTRFTMSEFAWPDKAHGINYKDMSFENINLRASDISVFNYNIWLAIDHLDLREKSGLVIDNLSSKRCGVDSSGMYYADVRLETTGSRVELDSLNFLAMNRSWYDWNDFENKMVISVRMKPSVVSSATVSYAAGFRLPHDVQVSIDEAFMRGAVPSMRGYMKGLRFAQSAADFDFSIVGLPDPDSTRFWLDMPRLRTSGRDLLGLMRDVAGTELEPSVASIVERTENLDVALSFHGLVKDFTSKIRVETSAGGTINVAAVLKPSAVAGSVVLVSTVAVDELQVGDILNANKLGVMNMQAQVRVAMGVGRRVVMQTKAEISKLRYGTYDFHSIELDGNILPSGFVGEVRSSDQNLDFTARGEIVIDDGEPRYDFDMDMRRADLAAVGFNTRDSISIFSAHLTAAANGRTLDDVNGSAAIDNILYINHLDTVRTGKIEIRSQNSQQLKELSLTSDFADVELRGKNSFSEIFRYFSKSLERFLPSFPDATHIVTGERADKSAPDKKHVQEAAFADGYYQLKVDVKQANNVAGIFVPGLEMAEGTKVNFFFNPYLDQFALRASSDFIGTPNLLAEQLELDSRNHGDSLSMFLTADYVRAGGIGMPEFSVIGGISHNVITLGGRFTDSVSHSSVLLRTTTTFERTADGMAQMQVALHPTPLKVNGNQWNMNPATVILDTTGIEVRNFSLSHAEQRLSISGRVGRTTVDTLHVVLSQFDISPASALVNDLGYRLSGRVGGDVRLVALGGQTRLFAALDFRDVELNDYKLGDPILRSTFDRDKGRINFVMGTDLENPPIDGYFSLANREWGGSIRFPKFDMVLLEPLLSGILTQTSGTADVKLTLRGKGDLPNLSGDVSIERYSVLVDYTKARYNLSGLVKVRDNCFYLDPTPINDGNGGTGTITAALTSQYFKNLKYDIEVSFADLLALNTTIKDNTSFYGKAYGTGRVSIKGDERRTDLSIVAATARSSEFVLPLSSASTIASADFIRFVDRSKPAVDPVRRPERRARRERVVRPAGSTDLDIKIDLQVLPNTLAQIEFDAKIGDVIKARGQGNLSMHINPNQDIFTMTGPVEITQGDYLFTLMTIFQRRFVLNDGGTLVWTGDPTDPQVDLSAIYKVKTSLAPLSQGDQGGQQTTANIDCSLLLSGNLLSPDIRFAITAPAADPETQNLLQNSINTEEALSMQFLSLMLSNSFMPDMGASAIGTMSGSFVGVTGIEFITNQLSQLISTEKVNVRLGYRPQTVATSDEIYAGVGGDLIQDVLSLEVDGNYNTGNNPTYNSRNPFTIDAYLTWNINKKRTLTLKGFTRTVDRFDESQGLQESGIGIYFRQDYQDLSDLRERLKRSFKAEPKPEKRAKRVRK